MAKWIGFVQWEGGIATASRRAPSCEAALELARDLAARLGPPGHVSVGATCRRFEIDPVDQDKLSQVLSGRGGDRDTTRRIDCQLVRIRAKMRWLEWRKKLKRLR